MAANRNLRNRSINDNDQESPQNLSMNVNLRSSRRRITRSTIGNAHPPISFYANAELIATLQREERVLTEYLSRCNNIYRAPPAADEPSIILNPEVEQVNPEVEQVNLEIEQVNPEIEQVNPEIEQVDPEIEQVDPEIEQVNPEIEQVDPEIEQVDPEIEQVDPEIEQVNPEVEQVYPEVEQVNHEVEEVNPEVNEGAEAGGGGGGWGGEEEEEYPALDFELDPEYLIREPIEWRPQSRRRRLARARGLAGSPPNEIRHLYDVHELPSVQERSNVINLAINSGTQPNMGSSDPVGDLFIRGIPLVRRRDEALRGSFEESYNVLSNALKRARTTESGSDESIAESIETTAPTKEPKVEAQSDEEKIFSQCSICLEQWEIEGKHRTVSLACGHLFGHCCIQQWFQTNKRTCPTCNQYASIQDIRYIYAKAIGAIQTNQSMIDENLYLKKSFEKSEKLLNRAITHSATARMENLRLRKKICTLKDRKKKLEIANGYCTCGAAIPAALDDSINIDEITHINSGASTASNADSFINLDFGSVQNNQNIKLSLEKTIALGNMAKSRCITYSKFTQCMYLTTKSNNVLFPGYAIHVYNMRYMNNPSQFSQATAKFVFVSKNPINDICLNECGDHLIIACKELGAKIMNLQSNSVSTILVQTRDVTQTTWSVAYDIVNAGKFILGLQNGTIVLSNQKTIIDGTFLKHACGHDRSPVISICPLDRSSSLPHGGILLCTFQSIWCLKYNEMADSIDTFINVRHPPGPYVSLKYDGKCNVAYVIARPSSISDCTRYIFTMVNFHEIDDGIVKCVIPKIVSGSTTHQIKSLGTFFLANGKLFTINFLEDERCIGIWNVVTSERVQMYHVDDFIYEICTFEIYQDRYVCALSETKCRVFKVHNQ